MNRFGFIGLGNQGGPMAHRMLDAGMSLTIWARRPEVCAGYTDKGAVVAASIAELGARCSHVGICVVDDAGVLDVCDELIPSMRAGSLIAIHSTILPETCVALAERCSSRGIALIDAPVSGGGPGASAGTLTVMCGGAADAFASALPVFETFGKTIVHLGDVGAGQRAKIVNNALMAANMGLAHAALSAGEALGIDRAALSELVKASSGRSFGFEVYARLPTPSAFAHGASLLVKDVKLITSILPENDGAQELCTAAEPFLSAAIGG